VSVEATGGEDLGPSQSRLAARQGDASGPGDTCDPARGHPIDCVVVTCGKKSVPAAARSVAK